MRWPPSRQFVQSTLDALSAHIAVLDQDGVIVAVNEAWRCFAAANGLQAPEFCLGQSYLTVCESVAGPDAAFAREAAAGIREVAAGGRSAFYLEYPCHSPTEERWFALRVTRFEGDGRGWVVVAHENITERKKAEDRQRVLLSELNHRVKNSLTVVQSIAAQTVREASSLEEFEEAFGGRLEALARTSTLVAGGSGREATELRELVETALEPYRTAEGREGNIRLSGGTVMVSPRTALALSLVLHELATNAAKYGALSVHDGCIDVTWDTPGAAVGGDGGRRSCLILTWAEHGGPEVRPPDKRGFGRRLIERSVAYELGGAARLEFPPDGLRCRIEVPLDGARSGTIIAPDR